MKIIVFAAVVFILTVALLFPWIYKNEKKEGKTLPFFVIARKSFGITFIMALLLTLIITLIFLVFVGMTNGLNALFSLNIPGGKLFILALCYFLYLFTLDHVFEVAVGLLLGKNILALLFLNIVRLCAFYLIGTIIELKHVHNLIIACGVALLTFLLDGYELLPKEEKG